VNKVILIGARHGVYLKFMTTYGVVMSIEAKVGVQDVDGGSLGIRIFILGS